MNRRWNDGILALLAVALFTLSELLRLSGALSQYWESIEIICNALMLGIAIFFSARERFSGQEQSAPSHRVVWIMLIPLIAFPMNVDVFRHTIWREHLLTDLWGWHIFWIGFAILQLLVLTPLGKEILYQIKSLLAQLFSFLKWGKGVAVKLGSILSGSLEHIQAMIEVSSKKKIFIFILGFSLWGCWLGAQISGQDIHVLLADTAFLGKNLLVWIDYLLVALLFSLFSSAVQKTKEGILSLDAKHVMAVIAVAAVLAASAFLLPFLYRIAGALLILISSLIAVVKWAVKRDKKKFGAKSSDGCPKNPEGSEACVPDGAPVRENPVYPGTSVRMEDLMVLLILFTAVPLSALILLALPTAAGQEFISKGPSDLAAWLDLWNSIIELANGLLQLDSVYKS